ncbi:MAG: hypothetical protein IT406_00465 [Candidatus Yanofskybacteria bacterium]|nr:hypothetical protein [Candidatus Yanofskybacteria bacterium]
MNPWLVSGLVLVWAALGILGWAWFNYMLNRAYPLGAGGAAVGSVKVFALLVGILGGPIAILNTAVEARNFPGVHRWGLRFW